MNENISSLSAVVGVDGGGTKTDVALYSLEGQCLAEIRGGAYLSQYVGPTAAIAGIGSLVDQALAQAREHSGQPVEIEQASLFLSGADYPEEIEALRQEIVAQKWPYKTHINNDTFALLRAGTSCPTAIAVVCGTGVNCVGRTSPSSAAGGEVVYRYPAIGPYSGDWGGGKHLTELCLSAAVRAEDGRGAATILSDKISDLCGTETMSLAIKKMYLDPNREQFLSKIPPFLFEAASEGDPLASTLVKRQAEEIVFLISAAAQTISPQNGAAIVGQPIPVVLGGSILAAKHQCLLDPLFEKLRELPWNFEPLVVEVPPVRGAVLDAFDRVGLTALGERMVV